MAEPMAELQTSRVPKMPAVSSKPLANQPMANDVESGAVQSVATATSVASVSRAGRNPKPKLNKRATRRGHGNKGNKNGKSKTTIQNAGVSFSILGTNADGIKPKVESLYAAMNYFKPSVVLLQETKVTKPGTLKIPGYQVFEKIRTDKGGGGLLAAVDEHLTPLLISTGNEEAEIMTVQVSVGNYQMRIINGYGPQEDEPKQIIYSFWEEIEKEVIEAVENNCMVLVELDANAKIGKEHIKGDPHECTQNGKLLLEMVKRKNLVIANALDICKGVITRERITKEFTEKSIIDYILMSKELMEFLTHVSIDDERIHTLNRYVGKKKHTNTRQIFSDHNWLFSKFNLQFSKLAGEVRKEVFQYKNEESKRAFLEETSIKDSLSSSFTATGIFKANAKIFFRKLKSKIQKCFKKTRIKIGNNKPLGNEDLQTKLKLKAELKIYLKNSKCKIAKIIVERTLSETELFLEDNFAKQTADIVTKHVEALRAEEGKFSHRGMWKLKRKLFPQAADPPMAKKDVHGNLITSPYLLKMLYADTYRHRLRQRKIDPKLNDIFLLKTELWERRCSTIKQKKTPIWNMNQLSEVLKSLKTNKTNDPNLMVNELFKEGCIGSDLEKAVLLLMNGIKTEMSLPEFVELADIVSIYKNKGSRLDLSLIHI